MFARRQDSMRFGIGTAFRTPPRARACWKVSPRKRGSASVTGLFAAASIVARHASRRAAASTRSRQAPMTRGETCGERAGAELLPEEAFRRLVLDPRLPAQSGEQASARVERLQTFAPGGGIDRNPPDGSELEARRGDRDALAHDLGPAAQGARERERGAERLVRAFVLRRRPRLGSSDEDPRELHVSEDVRNGRGVELREIHGPVRGGAGEKALLDRVESGRVRGEICRDRGGRSVRQALGLRGLVVHPFFERRADGIQFGFLRPAQFVLGRLLSARPKVDAEVRADSSRA